ncbi:MAG: class I SAM-dependent methyltransferase [bacterium]
MPRIEPFQKHTARYEQWFQKHRQAYQAELKAVENFLPERKDSLEIGVGTGRFAAPLGITTGLEPSPQMSKVAQKKGITIVEGIAEHLPFKNAVFQSVLIVTTVCFVDDIYQTFKEIFRVLAAGGRCIVGLVDRNSSLGKKYEKHKESSVFYREATFYSVEEIEKIMKDTGFTDFEFRQTIFHDLPEVPENEPVQTGYGKGSFAVIRGRKK